MNRGPSVLIRTVAIAIVTIASGTGCSSRHSYQRTLDSYLAAKQAGDAKQAATYLAPDARIWFDEKTGPGRPKSPISGWGAWDLELNAVNTYSDVEIVGNSLTALFHEQNDFSRLIGFPGWRSRSTYWFDEQGRIAEQLYEPMAQHPPMQAYFDAPLRWARTHHADELAAIYPEEQFRPNTDTARRWRTLLLAWRAETGLPISLLVQE